MSPQYLVRPDVAQAILSDAIRSRTPAVLTYQTPAGWAMLKSRLVGVQNDGQRLLLDLPRVTEPAEPQPGRRYGRCNVVATSVPVFRTVDVLVVGGCGFAPARPGSKEWMQTAADKVKTDLSVNFIDFLSPGTPFLQVPRCRWFHQ